jgi:hypothetical protein
MDDYLCRAALPHVWTRPSGPRACEKSALEGGLLLAAIEAARYPWSAMDGGFCRSPPLFGGKRNFNYQR